MITDGKNVMAAIASFPFFFFLILKASDTKSNNPKETPRKDVVIAKS